MQHLKTQIIEFDVRQRQYRQIDVNEIRADSFTVSSDKIYWIHYQLSSSEKHPEIFKKFNIPHDVSKLCQQSNAIPKLIESDESITLKFQCIREMSFTKTKEEHFGNLILHLTDRYCFTASHYDLPALLEFKESIASAIKFAKTSCFILFIILDNVVKDISQFLFNFELLADQMDIRVRENHESIYNELISIKRRITEVKRCMVAIREILMHLTGRKMSVISDDCRNSLINLFNQSQLIFHEIDSMRDVLNGLFSQIDYLLMQNLNESIRVLTAFASIFLPLTVITGIYGMNFQNMPELQWRYGYYFALLMLIVLGCGLFLFFKRKNWF